MIKYILFVSVILLTACNPKPKDQFIVPDKNEINEIVKTIVAKDSLVAKKIPLCADLIKINIQTIKINPNQILILPPPHDHSDFINIKALISPGHNGGYFNRIDSSYLVFQNDTLRSFKIANDLISGIKLTTNAIEDQDHRSSNYYAHYFELSIPIFSANRQSAYIIFNNYCPMCGSGGAIFLKKINGRWKIINQRYWWQS